MRREKLRHCPLPNLLNHLSGLGKLEKTIIFVEGPNEIVLLYFCNRTRNLSNGGSVLFSTEMTINPFLTRFKGFFLESLVQYATL